MKLLLSAISLFFSVSSFSQVSDHIHVSGKHILGPCGDTLILRGVNYAPYNWGYSPNELNIDQIALSGANSVRLVWYRNHPDPNTLYDNWVYLDSALSKCVQHQLIPILELHDFTCQNNASNLVQSSDFWTDPDLVAILLKYKHSVIVNIANEALYVNWAGNFTTALNTYKTSYQSLITALRNSAGFDFPIMIDAPDCGQSSDVFLSSGTAQSLLDYDPYHNLIFSAHAYWYGYANNDSTQMATKINNLVAANIPFVLGEIANQQDDATMCQYDLNYQALLNHCQGLDVSWLAWSWDRDGCTERRMSSTGSFNNLTAYGSDLIANPVYGLAHGVVKSQYLLNGGCSQTGIEAQTMGQRFEVFPNPVRGKLQIKGMNFSGDHSSQALDYVLYAPNGKIIQQGQCTGNIDVSALDAGMYVLQLGTHYQKIIIA